MLVPVKQEEPEPLTMEQKLDKVGDYVQSLCQTEEEYQELMTAMYQKMEKMLMPVEEPVIPQNQIEPRTITLNFTPSNLVSTKTRRSREKSNYNQFLQKVQFNITYSAEELTQLYNSTFKTDITTRGFGKLLETRKNFRVMNKFKDGKFLTGYIRYS